MRKVQWKRQVFVSVFSLMAAFVLAFTMKGLSIVSHAQSEGKAVVDATIRLDASKDSQKVGGILQDQSVSINGQVNGTDGNVWYQVLVNADTLGYVRSDLIQITDGSTPVSLNQAASGSATVIPVTASNETPAEVTEVNPVSASVSGGQAVRVRSNASTTSDIVTTVQSGMALTVTGQADGADSKVWYQVHFTVNGSEVTGFIRSDYVSLSGELTPVAQEPPADPEPTADPEPVADPEPIPEVKDYDTQLDGDGWKLIDNTGEQTKVYELQQMLEAVSGNWELYNEAEKTIKTQKIIIIILVVLVIILAMAVAVIFFKMKDMSDSAYFAEVEKETVRRRNSDRPQGDGARAGRSSGTLRQGGARPQGSAQGNRRPAGGGQGGQGGRPVQGRPAGGQGGRPQGEGRPAGGGQGGQGGRPQGEGRPAQGSQGGQGGRPQGEGRPAGGGQGGQGGRPAGGGRPRQEQAQPRQPEDNARKQGWKSKNFMADEDDEFEFEYLNWDGEEDQ